MTVQTFTSLEVDAASEAPVTAAARLESVLVDAAWQVPVTAASRLESVLVDAAAVDANPLLQQTRSATRVGGRIWFSSGRFVQEPVVWDFDGGVTASVTDDRAEVSWTTPGMKTVSASVVVNGTTFTTETTVEVLPETPAAVGPARVVGSLARPRITTADSSTDDLGPIVLPIGAWDSSDIVVRYIRATRFDRLGLLSAFDREGWTVFYEGRSTTRPVPDGNDGTYIVAWARMIDIEGRPYTTFVDLGLLTEQWVIVRGAADVGFAHVLGLNNATDPSLTLDTSAIAKNLSVLHAHMGNAAININTYKTWIGTLTPTGASYTVDTPAAHSGSIQYGLTQTWVSPDSPSTVTLGCHASNGDRGWGFSVATFSDAALANDCWVWDGAAEVPASVFVWDGIAQVPASLMIAPA